MHRTGWYGLAAIAVALAGCGVTLGAGLDAPLPLRAQRIVFKSSFTGERRIAREFWPSYRLHAAFIQQCGNAFLYFERKISAHCTVCQTPNSHTNRYVWAICESIA